MTSEFIILLNLAKLKQMDRKKEGPKTEPATSHEYIYFALRLCLSKVIIIYRENILTTPFVINT